MKRDVRLTLFLGVLVLTLLVLGGVYTYQKNSATPDRLLETYGMAEADSILPNGDTVSIPKAHTVGAFRFTDQTGHTVTEADFAGKVYVADFFFTTCESICIPMGKSIMQLARQFKGEPRVRFLSHTVDPETDSVPVLAAYARLHEADPTQWHLVTGPKKALYDMARYQYYVTAMQGDGGPDDFVHTQNFVLVDARRRIRGYYDGTQPEEMEKLRKDITILLQEIPNMGE